MKTSSAKPRTFTWRDEDGPHTVRVAEPTETVDQWADRVRGTLPATCAWEQVRKQTRDG